jgi:hypothetical protein
VTTSDPFFDSQVLSATVQGAPVGGARKPSAELNVRKRSYKRAELEAPVKVIVVRFHYRASWTFLLFPKWVQAWVLGRHVFFRRDLTEVHPEVMCHELAHVCQYAENGVPGFLWKYLWVERHLPYADKSFEVEARQFQGSTQEVSKRWPRFRLKIQR